MCKQHAAEAANHRTQCILQSWADCSQRGAEAGLAAHGVPSHAAPAAQVAAGGAPLLLLLRGLLLCTVPWLQPAHVQKLSGQRQRPAVTKTRHMRGVHSRVDLNRGLLSM